MGQFFSPRNLLRIIWRRLPIMLLILIIGLPLAVYFAVSQPRLYEATAVIQIEAPQIVQTNLQSPLGGGANSELDSIQQKLMSRSSMIDVIDRFDLFDGVESLSLKVGFLRESVSILKLIDPAQAFRPDVQPSGLIITVTMDDPDEAALVANYFLDTILSEEAARSEERATRTLAFFTEQEDRVTADIQAVEEEISSFKLANAGSLPSDLTAQQERLNDLRGSILAIDTQLIELQSGSDRLRNDDALRQIELLGQQRALQQREADQVEAALAAAPDVERQLSALDRRLEQLETEYEAITTNRTEAAIREQLESQDQAERYEILEEAIAPEQSVSASRSKIAMAGGVLVGMLALAAAFALELSRPVIRNAAQLEAQLGVQPVITVPHLTGRMSRQRMWASVGVLGALIAIPAWFLLGLKEVVLRLFGGTPAAS